MHTYTWLFPHSPPCAQLEFDRLNGSVALGYVSSTTAQQLQYTRVEAFGKGLLQPTAFRFTTQWRSVAPVSYCSTAKFMHALESLGVVYCCPMSRLTVVCNGTVQVMSFDPWVSMSTGVLTSGSLNLPVLVGGLIVALAIPLVLCACVSIQRCRVCCCYLWLAAWKTRHAPNRQSAMTGMEKREYRLVHGPFPQDPPTREIIAMARSRR